MTCTKLHIWHEIKSTYNMFKIEIFCKEIDPARVSAQLYFRNTLLDFYETKERFWKTICDICVTYSSL